MCRGCLAALRVSTVHHSRDWREALWLALAAAGWLFAWMLFYLLGDLLSRVPHDWHGGAS